jgi:EpsI family protein
MTSWLRFLPVAALLAFCALILHSRGHEEVVRPREGLASFPTQLGEWVGADQPVDSETRQALGGGDFLDRSFRESNAAPPVDLFLAYYASQRTGDTIHSPKNCLPGAGWAPIAWSRLQLRDSDGKLMWVNRYVVARRLDRMLVLYWYQAHGRAITSEYWAKFHLIADSIRLNRSDGGLVRIVTPIANGETEQQAQERSSRFAALLLPLLDRFIPR